VSYLEKNLRDSRLETHQFLDERVVRSNIYVIHLHDLAVPVGDSLRVQVRGQGKGRSDVISAGLTDDSYAWIEILDSVINEIGKLQSRDQRISQERSSE